MSKTPERCTVCRWSEPAPPLALRLATAQPPLLLLWLVADTRTGDETASSESSLIYTQVLNLAIYLYNSSIIRGLSMAAFSSYRPPQFCSPWICENCLNSLKTIKPPLTELRSKSSALNNWRMTIILHVYAAVFKERRGVRNIVMMHGRNTGKVKDHK